MSSSVPLNVEGLLRWVAEVLHPLLPPAVIVTIEGRDFVIEGPMGRVRTFCGELAAGWEEENSTKIAERLLELCLDSIQDYISELTTDIWPSPDEEGRMPLIEVTRIDEYIRITFASPGRPPCLSLPLLDLRKL